MPARRATRRTIRPAAWRSLEALATNAEEDRTLHPLADGEVDGPGRARSERDGRHLSALAPDPQRTVAPLEADVLDVGTQGLGDPQPVESEQRDESVVARGAEASGDEERPELVAVESHGVRFHVDPRTANVNRWGVLEQSLLLGVAVEADDRAEAAGHSGPGPALGLERPNEALDVDSTHGEEGKVVLSHQVTNWRRSKA